MNVRVGAASHVGRVRSANEDAYLAAEDLALVADGMGGHAAGDVASAIAVQAFRDLLSEGPLTPAGIQEALAHANTSILEQGAADSARAGMGTTVAGVARVNYAGSPHWLVFNVGDSRIYRLLGESLVQLTVDHSEAAELASTGQISPDEARSHPLRHVLTRSLGTDPAPVADVWVFPQHDTGETFLLCSDGLTDEVSDELLRTIMLDARGPRDAASGLIEAALEAGGKDNVTAVVLTAFQVTSADRSQPSAATTTVPRPELESLR